MDRPPLIDVAALLDRGATPSARAAAAAQIDAAAGTWGFFYAANHGVDTALIDRVVAHARAFFAQDAAEKMRIPMAAGGTAWRGYFPAGGELTSGRPDWKEGLYLGSELAADHPRVREGVILHGPNLWPAIPGFRDTVLAYLDAMEALGHALMRGCALGLGLPEDWFADHGTRDPLLLLRFFNYPTRPVPKEVDAAWGVGEHTDYGLLTMLWQDDVGGLQVRKDGEWFDAPPVPGTFVCNIGDMLDRMTGGRWRSVPHRVAINTSGRDRLSIPLFFDPDFDTVIAPGTGRRPGPGRQRAALGWRQPAVVPGHLRRLRDGQGGEGVSRTPAGAGMTQRARACIAGAAMLAVAAHAQTAPPFEVAYRAWEIVTELARQHGDPAISGTCGKSFRPFVIPGLRPQNRQQQDESAAACVAAARAACANPNVRKPAEVLGKCGEFR